ncbi:MAG: GvpL/GvpF family gas vesicle protein, partial [Desulfomonile tiedjei]|nr:GvpL/GvpF family gas vesicle protein [Desulfomonile tiedjei]
CAAVSAISQGEIPKDSSAILAYHGVIESFHNSGGVIPLRFGTIVDQESDVNHLLQNHNERYKRLLEELGDCAEMGLRVIVNSVSAAAEACSETPTIPLPTGSGSGAAHLARLKARHDAQALASARYQATIERYRSPFTGLFVNFKAETSRFALPDAPANSVFLSLHFLISKQSVEPFRKAYVDLKLRENTKMMLSGPWPPYNFVLPEDC